MSYCGQKVTLFTDISQEKRNYFVFFIDIATNYIAKNNYNPRYHFIIFLANFTKGVFDGS